MSESKKVKWGPKDCAVRFLYKISSQKIVAFVFATGAMFIVLVFAYKAKVMTTALALSALKAVKEIAIVLLAVRLGQGAIAKFSDKKSGGKKDGDIKGEI